MFIVTLNIFLMFFGNDNLSRLSPSSWMVSGSFYPVDSRLEIRDISVDGSVVVGEARTPGGMSAFVYKVKTGEIFLLRSRLFGLLFLSAFQIQESKSHISVTAEICATGQLRNVSFPIETGIREDFDFDGDIDLEDFGLLQRHLNDDMTVETTAQGYDLNGDGIVEKTDVSMFIQKLKR